MTDEALDTLTDLDFDLIQMSDRELDAFATAAARESEPTLDATVTTMRARPARRPAPGRRIERVAA